MPHANLAKLCDSQIHYARNIDVVREYITLRQRAKDILSSSKRLERTGKIKQNIKLHFEEAMLSDELGDMRAHAAEVVFDAFDLVMLSNGRYFKKGIKRTFCEMEDLLKPDGFSCMVMDLVRAKDLDGLKKALTRFVRSILAFYEDKKDKEAPCPDNICGSYEEMYSNWRNKAYEAAKKEDVFSSFMSLACMSLMWKDIAMDVTLPELSILADFDPEDLFQNAALYDRALSDYLSVYEKAGMKAEVYENVDAFLKVYLEA